MPELDGQSKIEEVCFSRFLKVAKDSAARIELSRSFHQMGKVHEKISESDLMPLWDSTIMRKNTSFKRAHRSEVLNLGKGMQSQRWFCRQTLMP